MKKKITAILLCAMMLFSFSAISTTVSAETATRTNIVAYSVSRESRNALYKAKQYNKYYHMSKKRLYKQLTSKYGEGFNKKAATYAVNHVNANWNKNALYQARQYRKTFHMSKSRIYKQLVSSYGEAFTKSQARYAIKHL